MCLITKSRRKESTTVIQGVLKRWLAGYKLHFCSEAGESNSSRFIRLDNRMRKWKIETMKAAVSLVCILLVGVCVGPNVMAETKPAGTERYGPYPTNYKEIVMKWLETQLIESISARIEWNGRPKPGDLGKETKLVSGLP